jgi:transcriptional regulator NrdR family protein
LKEVIKMDGRREEFSREKIVVSCLKTGSPLQKAREIADKVEASLKFPAKTSTIRDMVLKELAAANKEWANNWYIYDKAVKKRIVTY